MSCSIASTVMAVRIEPLHHLAGQMGLFPATMARGRLVEQQKARLSG